MRQLLGFQAEENFGNRTSVGPDEQNESEEDEGYCDREDCFNLRVQRGNHFSLVAWNRCQKYL